MTKQEKKRLIEVLDLWIESCERFYNTFKNDFSTRLDAVNELKTRCDKVCFMNEFLEEGHFISTDKYLEIADRYEKILDDLESAVETLSDAFNSLKSDCVDALEDIESELENIIENNELDSTLNKLKELKKVVAYQHKMVENMDCC